MIQSEDGASLPESLLAVVILGVLVLLMANIPNAMMLISKSRHLSLAREIAVKQIEDKRSINYTNLINDTAELSDPRLSLLPEGSGTVIVEDCSPAVCTNGESLKQVTVTVNWLDNNKDQSIALKTMIGEGGINQ